MKKPLRVSLIVKKCITFLKRQNQALHLILTHSLIQLNPPLPINAAKMKVLSAQVTASQQRQLFLEGVPLEKVAAFKFLDTPDHPVLWL